MFYRETVLLTLLSLVVTHTAAGNVAKIAVDEHNRVRAKVGASLPNMKWSAEIARMSQNYANGCVAQHSTREQRKGTGENLYMYSAAMSQAEAIKAAVASWEGEKKNYDYASNSCRAGMCGHYTQIIWKTSTEVGCAVGNCPNSTWKTFVVCNYKGPGNFSGRKPY